MNLVYLLSTELDYGRCIARDCGPSYAKDHGLKSMPWTEAAALPAEVVRVVDTRLQAGEQAAPHSSGSIPSPQTHLNPQNQATWANRTGGFLLCWGCGGWLNAEVLGVWALRVG